MVLRMNNIWSQSKIIFQWMVRIVVIGIANSVNRINSSSCTIAPKYYNNALNSMKIVDFINNYQHYLLACTGTISMVKLF